MPGRIPDPEVGPFLRSFIDAHRSKPWYESVATPACPSGILFDLYADEARSAGMFPAGQRRPGDPEEPVLNGRDFGLALQGLGIYYTRTEQGRNYPDLTEQTRLERAIAALQEQWNAMGKENIAAQVTLEHLRDVEHFKTKSRDLTPEEETFRAFFAPRQATFPNRDIEVPIDWCNVTEHAFALTAETKRREAEYVPADSEQMLDGLLGEGTYLRAWVDYRPGQPEPDEEAFSSGLATSTSA